MKTNTESKHTPGEWQVVEPSGEWPRVQVGETWIAKTDCSMQTDNFASYKDAQANARLIAAAPDLLEALKGVLRVADRATDEFDAARAAISKAQGKEDLTK